MQTLHILSVAPYPEFQELTKQVASDFPNVHIDVFSGNLESAVSYARMFPHQEFDAIISRGGTATLLQQRVSIPVIEVEVSVYDMLRTLKQAESCHGRSAIVGYCNIVKIARNLCEILRYHDMEIYEVTSSTVADCIKQLKEKGITLIVGDVMSVEAATQLGLRGILITSTTDSVKKAISDSIYLCQSIQKAKISELLYREIANAADMGILLLNGQSDICIANTAMKELGEQQIRECLAPLIPQIRQQERIRIYRKLNRQHYEIRAQKLSQSGEDYFLFFLNAVSKAVFSLPSISVERFAASPQNVHFLFSSSEYISPVLDSLQKLRDSHTPIVIQGQVGTEKDSVARYLHWDSSHHGQPFVYIHCDLLTEKQWAAFCSTANSPVSRNGCTLFFHNIHLLSKNMQKDLASYLSDTAAFQRHYIVSSCSPGILDLIQNDSFSSTLYRMMFGAVIHMPSLNERSEDIPTLANLYIAKLNGEYGKQVVGFEDGAIDLLKHFHWTLNLDQLQSTLAQLVSTTNNYYITAEEVRAVLGNSECAPTFGKTFGVDLSKPLDEIEFDIISRVMNEESMNQSAVAKRLGISRSTIWRKLHGNGLDGPEEL